MALIKGSIIFLTRLMTQQPTLQAKDVPSVLHEPAIHGGYRVPYKPWTYYILSLFQIHNETLNVWTHLIGSVLVIYKLMNYREELMIGQENYIQIPFALSGFICVFISTFVHLFHSKSPYIHFVGFTIDYIGAAMMGFGYGIACFYGLTDNQTFQAYKDVYLIILSTVAFFNFMSMCSAKILYGHDPHNMKRKYMMLTGMLVQYIVNLYPVLPRYKQCLYDSECSLTSLNHVSLVYLGPIVQGITFAAHQPETTWPGKFDVIGHGHQILHVFAVSFIFHTIDGIHKDYQDGITKDNEVDLGIILGTMFLLVFTEALIIKFYTVYVPSNVKQDVTDKKS